MQFQRGKYALAQLNAIGMIFLFGCHHQHTTLSKSASQSFYTSWYFQYIKSMPFCALNVPELPLHEWIKDRSPSPCVVDIQEYMKYQPQVHIYRGALAPLDVAFTCLWTLNPEFLQQFLNPRLPLCILRSTRKINPRSTSEATFVRLKISDFLHLIVVRFKRQYF